MPRTKITATPPNSGPGKFALVDPEDDAVDPERETRRSCRATPSAIPIHWIGCGQKPARTCSASRVSRSGE